MPASEADYDEQDLAAHRSQLELLKEEFVRRETVQQNQATAGFSRAGTLISSAAVSSSLVVAAHPSIVSLCAVLVGGSAAVFGARALNTATDFAAVDEEDQRKSTWDLEPTQALFWTINAARSATRARRAHNQQRVKLLRIGYALLIVQIGLLALTAAFNLLSGGR